MVPARAPDCPNALLFLDAVRPADLPENLQIVLLLASARCLHDTGNDPAAQNAIDDAKLLIQNNLIQYGNFLVQALYIESLL